MTLSASSALHYFDARYGSIPVIGGAPTFSRSSAGSWVDQTGTLQSAIVNTPRTEWAQLYGEDPSTPTTLGRRRPVLRLEQARTNLLTYSSDFSNASWTKTGFTVTTGIPDPAGGTAACTFVATGATPTLSQDIGAGSSIIRCNSVWVKARSGAGNVTLKSPQSGDTTVVAVSSQWQRIGCANTFADTTRRAILVMDNSLSSIDVFGFQMEDAAVSSAYIPTAGATVTRATDVCSWGHFAAPQAAVLYVRFVENGTVGTNGNKLLQIGKSDDSAARLVIDVSGGFYRALHQTGGGTVTSTLAAAPAFAQTVELLLTLYSDGHLDFSQSINGAAVSSGATSGALALASSWSDTKLWLNSLSTSSPGLAQFANVKFVKQADVAGVTQAAIMSELRSFALDSRQGVL